MPDGNLVFDTKIDERGFDKGAKNLSSKTLDLKNKIADTAKVIENLRDELEKTANTKVKTKATENIERDVAKAKDKLAELDAQADRIIDKKRSDFGISENDDRNLEYFLKQDKEWGKIQEKIAAAEAQLSRYQSNLRRVNESAPLMKDTAEYKNKQQRLEELTGKLDVYKAKLYETEQAEQREAQQTANASGSTKDYKARLNQTITALKMLERGLGKAYNGLKKVASSTIGRGIKNLSGHFKKANSSTNVLEKSLKRIKNTLVRMFFFRLVHSPIDAVKEGLGEISKISSQVNKNLSDLKTSSSYLKNSFASLAAPLLNLVTPAFVNFLDITAEVTDKVARLIAVLSGQSSYTKAVRVQQDYAASLDESTESLQNNTKAAEENQRNLAGFDELNVMQDNSPNNTDVSPGGSNPMFSNVETQVTGLEGSLLDALRKLSENDMNVRTVIAYDALAKLYEADATNDVYRALSTKTIYINISSEITRCLSGNGLIVIPLFDGDRWYEEILNDTYDQDGDGMIQSAEFVRNYLIVNNDWKNSDKKISYAAWLKFLCEDVAAFGFIVPDSGKGSFKMVTLSGTPKTYDFYEKLQCEEYVSTGYTDFKFSIYGEEKDGKSAHAIGGLSNMNPDAVEKCYDFTDNITIWQEFAKSGNSRTTTMFDRLINSNECSIGFRLAMNPENGDCAFSTFRPLKATVEGTPEQIIGSPITIIANKTNPDGSYIEQDGEYVKEEINSYVFKRTLSGIQALTDEIEVKGQR